MTLRAASAGRPRRRQRRFPVDLLVVAALVALQAWLVSPLFAGEFTRVRGSIEATFIANARFIVERFPDLSWYPFWYLGFPFELFYTPLLPGAVAILGKLAGDVPNAYRVVAALGYAIGPAALYLAAREITRSSRAALLAALAFVFAPSTSYLFGPLHEDALTFAGAALPPPWRLIALVEYGEGPHVLSLSLALLAVAATLRYLRVPSAGRLGLAVAALVAVALTNLIGALGVAIFVFGLAVAKGPGTEIPSKWRRLSRLGLLTVLFSLGWYSVGFMRAFSQPGGGDTSTLYVALPLVLLGAYAASEMLRLRRLPLGGDVVAIWLLVLAAIVVPKQLFGVGIAPQPIRYLLELDAAFAIAIGIVAAAAIGKVFPSFVRGVAATAAASVMLVALGLPGWLAVQPRLAPDEAWRSWTENQVALWLAGHLQPGERAYLTGDHAFWVNVFADVPQIRGGQDYSAVDPWPAHATFQINTGPDVEISKLWLEAFSVRYVVVPTGSSDVYRDFNNPAKFDGVFPVAFEDRGVRVYEVPLVGDPRAVVVAPADLEPPTNGIDRPALEAYVQALAGSSRPWNVVGELGRWHIVTSAAGDGHLLLRQAFDSGWRARLDGRDAPVGADALGMVSIAVPGGVHVIDLDHRVHLDFLAGLLVATLTGIALLARAARASVPRRVVVTRSLGGVAGGGVVAAAVLVVGAVLGAWSGFPKGTDAPSHLTRLKFAADWFPSENWLYTWAAGMPTFETYPALPYLLGIVPVRLIGAELTLTALALLSMLSFGLGLYFFLALATRSRLAAFLAALVVVTSMAIWTWIVHDGVYARIVACGFGAWAWYAHERWRAKGTPAWLVATAALLATTVASHAFMGLVFAGVVALRTLPRLGPLARLGGLALLIGAPAWLPAYASGAGRFFGAAHGAQVHSPIEVLWSAEHVGLAAPLFLALALGGSLVLRRRPPALFLILTALAVLYVFAPSLGIPNAYYYVNGIDSFTVTFFVALFAACAGAFAWGAVGARLRPAVALVATAAVVLAAVAGASSGSATLLAGGGYPMVYDATAPGGGPSESMRTLRLPDDLEHRVMPSSADESVWISYRSRMPQLRDYYSQGQLHPEWLALAYTTMYDPPYEAASARALLDWYAVSIVTVETTSGFRRNLPAMAASGDFRIGGGEERYARLDVVRPAPLVVAMDIPFTVVVGNEELYRVVTRALLRAGVGSDRAVPVWWPGPLSALDAGTLARTGVLVVGATDAGDGAKAAAAAHAVARAGGRVVLDLAGWSETEALADLVPMQGVRRVDFPPEWGLRGDADTTSFAPAKYEGGPWAAEAGTALSDGARAVLSLGDLPVVAQRRDGAGEVVALGGNLLFHADYTRNVAERSFLLPYLVPSGEHATARALTGSFRDPEHRVVVLDGPTCVLFKESWTPAWQAELVSADDTRALSVFEAGPGVMAVVVPEAGTLHLTYGARLSDLIGWALFLVGVSLSGLILLRRVL